MTKHRTEHGRLGSGRISHAPNPISSELKLGRAGSRSRIQNLNQISFSVEWNRCDPLSYFEMRPSRPRGLWVAHHGTTALADIFRDPSPSDPSDLHLSASLLPCIYRSSSLFGWDLEGKIIHVLIRSIISNETSKPVHTFKTWHSFC